MFQSIKQFSRLCVFRGTPANTDGRPLICVLLFLTLSAVESATILGMGWLSWIDSTPSLQTIVADVFRVLGKICEHLFVGLCLYVVLHVRNSSQYFRQTYSSYLGVCIIITFISLMVIDSTVLISSHQDLGAFFHRQNGYLIMHGSVFLVVSIVYATSTVWKILAFGRILNKSMQVKFWHGGIIAIMLIQAPEVFEALAELLGWIGHAIRYSSEFGIF